MWNSRSHACIRTISGEYVLSLGFVPGNRHVVCGTKDGRLLIFDIAAAELVSSVPDAHKVTHRAWRCLFFFFFFLLCLLFVCIGFDLVAASKSRRQWTDDGQFGQVCALLGL